MIGQKGTLTRQLVTRVGIVVATVVVLLSTLITLWARHTLIERLDRQLEAAVALQVQNASQGGPNRPGGALPGIPPGTIILQQTAPTDLLGVAPVRAYQIERGKIERLSDEVAQEVFNAEPTRRGGRTITLTGYGSFRAAVVDRDGLRTVVAVPMSDVRSSTRSILMAVLVLGLVSVVGAMAVAGLLVRRSLRPLNALAAAAREVSALELDRGEVELPVRVETAKLDPNNEVARVGQSFNHMLNNVESALSARQASETKVRQFVADASHELRNPLAAIRGYSELSRRRFDAIPADIQHALTRIDSESSRMSKLVNDLLLLARLDNEPTLALSPVDVTEVVLNAVSDAKAADEGHHWRISVPDEPTMVAGESDRLHQVVTNLLTNARLHTPQGSTIETSVAVEDDTVVVRVVDDGPGIPEDAQHLVFERFARLDAARAHNTSESTGLGLAIVAAVVGAHGGRVGLQSRPGRTEFAVFLPAQHQGV